MNSRAGGNIDINFDVRYADIGHARFDSGASRLQTSHLCLSTGELGLFSSRDGLKSGESALQSGRARFDSGKRSCPTARRDFVVRKRGASFGYKSLCVSRSKSEHRRGRCAIRPITGSKARCAQAAPPS